MNIQEMSLIEESILGAISGIDGVDSLLIDGGYTEESSARLHLAIVRSVLSSQICKIKELEDCKADIEEETRMVMSEKCPTDEVHCTCVPVLRRRIADLEKQVEDLKSEYKECHTFSSIQKLASDWSNKNFGNHFGSGYRNLLGIAEEVGELCHAQLKGEQGIRHTPEEILQMKKDAIGDIIIFICNYCDSQNLSLHECVNIAWNVIKKRNWQSDNMTQKERG